MQSVEKCKIALSIQRSAISKKKTEIFADG